MPIELEIKQGEVFGRLSIIEELDRHNERRMFSCLCECGTICTAMLYKMRSGATKSCGCLKRSGMHVTHGLTRGEVPPEYRIWTAIKSRCFNPQATAYIRYGGAGIVMVQAWRDNYEIFFAYVGSRPSSIHSIDRFPNNKGNYEPGNVRWATPIEQANNQCTNIVITLNGRSLTVAQWARELDLNIYTLYQRVERGWSDYDVLTKPVRGCFPDLKNLNIGVKGHRDVRSASEALAPQRDLPKEE